MTIKPNVLVVDDEETSRLALVRFLAQTGTDVAAAGSYADAVRAIDERKPDLVLTDIMLGAGTGIDVLKYVKQNIPACPVIIVTGAPSLDNAADAVRHDAFEYITKPVRREQIVKAVGAALKYKQLSDERESYRSDLDAIFHGMLDAVVLVDGNGAVRQANDAAIRLSGRSSPDTAGLSIRDLFNDFSTLHQSLESTMRSRARFLANRSEWQTGRRTRIISYSISPIRTEEWCRGAVIVLKDETPVVELERELHERRTMHHLVGKSPRMQRIYEAISALATVDSTALITGESGTGKELVADAIHSLSPRRDKPLVKINCAALPETLLESELFGHVRGAFTGAVQDRTGRFQAASGGSIFLDEIGDISPSLQLRLLRVLQNREIERIGHAQPVKVDVRIMAATNRDLRTLVKKGSFREDLYYRLKVVEIRMPPLRERKEDIPMLIAHFLEKLNLRLGKAVTDVSPEALRALLDHDWPGNVRELEHEIERAMLFSKGPSILAGDLSLDDCDLSARNAGNDDDERKELLNALERTGWNKSKAARFLGVNRVTVHRKMKRLGLHEETEL